MTTIDETKDTAEYLLLKKKSKDLQELIQHYRIESNLLPLFRAKRPFTAVARDENEEEGSQTKQLKTSNESDNKINDRVELMARLSSYSFLFHYIPRPVSALDCAKHGWKDTKSLSEKDPHICVLTCDTCNNNMFVIDIDLKARDQQKVSDIKKKYDEGLFKCHKEDCLWRNMKCADNVYNFPLKTISEGLERFESEAKNLILACKNNDHSFPKIQHPKDDKITSKIQYFAKRAMDQTIAPTETEIMMNDMEVAYLLSLYGWKSLDASIPGVKCDLCFSKKAFYQMKEGEELNVLEEHKTYCPWKNANTADAYTPRGLSTSLNHKLSGPDWMKEVVCLEYGLLVKKDDLSLSSRQLTDEKLYNLKQKIYESYDLLNSWKSSTDN